MWGVTGLLLLLPLLLAPLWLPVAVLGVACLAAATNATLLAGPALAVAGRVKADAGRALLLLPAAKDMSSRCASAPSTLARVGCTCLA